MYMTSNIIREMIPRWPVLHFYLNVVLLTIVFCEVNVTDDNGRSTEVRMVLHAPELLKMDNKSSNKSDDSVISSTDEYSEQDESSQYAVIDADFIRNLFRNKTKHKAKKEEISDNETAEGRHFTGIGRPKALLPPGQKRPRKLHKSSYNKTRPTVSSNPHIFAREGGSKNFRVKSAGRKIFDGNIETRKLIKGPTGEVVLTSSTTRRPVTVAPPVYKPGPAIIKVAPDLEDMKRAGLISEQEYEDLKNDKLLKDASPNEIMKAKKRLSTPAMDEQLEVPKFSVTSNPKYIKYKQKNPQDPEEDAMALYVETEYSPTYTVPNLHYLMGYLVNDFEFRKYNVSSLKDDKNEDERKSLHSKVQGRELLHPPGKGRELSGPLIEGRELVDHQEQSDHFIHHSSSSLSNNLSPTAFSFIPPTEPPAHHQEPHQPFSIKPLGDHGVHQNPLSFRPELHFQDAMKPMHQDSSPMRPLHLDIPSFVPVQEDEYNHHDQHHDQFPRQPIPSNVNFHSSIPKPHEAPKTYLLSTVSPNLSTSPQQPSIPSQPSRATVRPGKAFMPPTVVITEHIPSQESSTPNLIENGNHNTFREDHKKQLTHIHNRPNSYSPITSLPPLPNKSFLTPFNSVVESQSPNLSIISSQERQHFQTIPEQHIMIVDNTGSHVPHDHPFHNHQHYPSTQISHIPSRSPPSFQNTFPNRRPPPTSSNFHHTLPAPPSPQPINKPFLSTTPSPTDIHHPSERPRPPQPPPVTTTPFSTTLSHYRPSHQSPHSFISDHPLPSSTPHQTHSNPFPPPKSPHPTHPQFSPKHSHPRDHPISSGSDIQSHKPLHHFQTTHNPPRSTTSEHHDELEHIHQNVVHLPPIHRDVVHLPPIHETIKLPTINIQSPEHERPIYDHIRQSNSIYPENHSEENFSHIELDHVKHRPTPTHHSPSKVNHIKVQHVQHGQAPTQQSPEKVNHIKLKHIQHRPTPAHNSPGKLNHLDFDRDPHRPTPALHAPGKVNQIDFEHALHRPTPTLHSPGKLNHIDFDRDPHRPPPALHAPKKVNHIDFDHAPHRPTPAIHHPGKGNHRDFDRAPHQSTPALHDPGKFNHVNFDHAPHKPSPTLHLPGKGKHRDFERVKHRPTPTLHPPGKVSHIELKHAPHHSPGSYGHLSSGYIPNSPRPADISIDHSFGSRRRRPEFIPSNNLVKKPLRTILKRPPTKYAVTSPRPPPLTEYYASRPFSNEIGGHIAGVPGRANRYYPAYSKIPRTSFHCIGKFIGYYADPEAQCQVFHMCDHGNRKSSFLCPNGTLFSQQLLTCDHWGKVDCLGSSKLYHINKKIYGIPEKKPTPYRPYRLKKHIKTSQEKTYSRKTSRNRTTYQRARNLSSPTAITTTERSKSSSSSNSVEEFPITDVISLFTKTPPPISKKRHKHSTPPSQVLREKQMEYAPVMQTMKPHFVNPLKVKPFLP